METDGVPPSPQPLPASSQSTEVLLKVRHLRIWFPLEHDWLGTPLRFLRAVEDVSFDLHRGEVLGLVGKSGSGKSTLSRAIMGLQSIESGQMYFEDKDLARLSGSEWRGMRREVQMLFRDPISALDPRRSVGEAIIEPMLVQGIVRQQEALKEAQRLMSLVHLPADVLTRYPHQLDEEHCQRITIARAISLRPKLIICDECLDAMDISVQAQLLNLLKELQAALKLSILFSSNDLNMIHYMADRVIVMQSGKIVERGSADEVIKHPKEPYTKKLVAAML
jgi:ABC-type oligopeptide transport system ATPase subunit